MMRQMLDHASLQNLRAKIAPHIHRTPIMHSATLSRLSGFDVYLKAELFQKTGSYKPRGMLWALMSMTPEQRARGVITFSAGNAAQGLAYAGGILGARSAVVMPAAASPAKAQATRDYGAEVFLHGATAGEAFSFCRQLAEERGLTYQPSYDDLALMQGHATMGLELVEDLQHFDAVMLGVGGGGMIGGVTLAMQACGHDATIIGVEPEGAPAMHRSFAEGKAVVLDKVSTIADGLAAPSAGAQCYEICRERVKQILLVPDQEIANGLRLLMERCKLFAEPAGAAAIAGLLSGRTGLPSGARVVCVVSGGNLDLARIKTLFPS
jgi:threonine dehydratase